MEPAGEMRIFVCPLCKQRIKALAQRAGKRAKCGNCKRLIILVPEETPSSGDIVDDLEQKQEWWDNPELEIQEPQQTASARVVQERMKAMEQHTGVHTTHVHPYAAAPKESNLWLILLIAGLVLLVGLIVVLIMVLG